MYILQPLRDDKPSLLRQTSGNIALRSGTLYHDRPAQCNDWSREMNFAKQPCATQSTDLLAKRTWF